MIKFGALCSLRSTDPSISGHLHLRKSLNWYSRGRHVSDAGTHTDHLPRSETSSLAKAPTGTHLDFLTKPGLSRRPHKTGDRRDREDADYSINDYTSTIHVNVAGRLRAAPSTAPSRFMQRTRSQGRVVSPRSTRTRDQAVPQAFSAAMSVNPPAPANSMMLAR